MTFSFEILPDCQIILASYRGEITIADFQASIHAIWEAENYDPFFDGLFDMRQAVARYRRSDLMALVLELNHDPRHARGRRALLVEDPVTTALGQLYASLTGKEPLVDIYSTSEAALTWLGTQLPLEIAARLAMRPRRASIPFSGSSRGNPYDWPR